MMTNQNSVMHLLVGKNIARTASVTATDPSATTYAADGEIVVTDMSGTVLNSTTVLGVSKIKLVQSQGASLPAIVSPVIELSGVKTYSSKLYTAPTVQIDYIGYNAVTNTGDIDVINDNGYEIMIHDMNSAAYGSTGVDKFGFYVSDSSATKLEINDGLAVNLYQNMARVIRKPFIVERVASATSTNTSAATGTLTATNGLTTVTATVSATAEFTVGGYIRFGTAATDTAAIYKITAASGTTLTLDMPYQGSTGTFAAGAAGYLSAALAVAGSVGLRLTGQATVFTSPASTQPYINRWSVNLRNFGATTTTNAQAATEGVGSYPYTASLEYFLIGNEGFISRNDIPYVNPRACVLSTGTYNFLTLEWESQLTTGIFAKEPNRKQLLVAFDFTPAAAPTQVTGAVTSVQTVLNAWISSSIGAGTLA